MEFLAALLGRAVSYYLTKELPLQLGPDRRFKSLTELNEFEDEIRVWSRERAQIASDFSGAWLSKTRYRSGEPTLQAAKTYLRYALAKVGSEVAAHHREDS